MFLRHILRKHSIQSLHYGRRAFRRPFRASSPAFMDAGELPPAKESIGKRTKNKARESAEGVFYIIVGVFIYSLLPSWEETLDAICRVVPPKIVSGDASSLTPSAIYSPTHQDPATRQPINLPDEFRILIVEPGSGTQEVRCRLVNVTPSWRTRYDALSYNWGDESLRETVFVDGLRTSITRNLHTALIHLRDPVRQRILWTDALCINQEDLDERDEQVKKMGSIYSKARNTVVWLGEQTPEVQEAFSTIRKARYGTVGPADWSPVFCLLRRPWFQRTWIIQEAVLAREPLLACGFETMPWSELSACCKSDGFQTELPDDDAEVDQALRAVDMITHGRKEHHTSYVSQKRRKTGPRSPKNMKQVKYTPDFRLVSTLYETRGFQCKDEHDKLFGVLSMVTNVGQEDEVRKLGYKTSMEEILETIAKWDISKNESLELLSYCSRKAWTHSKLPSWVPDFADIDDANSISFLLGVKKSSLEPNIGFKYGNHPFFFKENDKAVLVVSGSVVDTIARVGAVVDNSKMVIYDDSKKGDKELPRLDMAVVLKRREWFHECIQIASEADPVSHEGFGNATSFWKSHTLGMSHQQFGRIPFVMAVGQVCSKGHIRGYAKFLYRDVEINPCWHQVWKKSRNSQPSYESIDRYFRRHLHNRRFCATKGGRLGCVPGAAKEGDLVCQISGAQVPIILRRVPAKNRYMVIGDAYVDGMMLARWDKGSVYFGGDRLAIV